MEQDKGLDEMNGKQVNKEGELYFDPKENPLFSRLLKLINVVINPSFATPESRKLPVQTNLSTQQNF